MVKKTSAALHTFFAGHKVFAVGGVAMVPLHAGSSVVSTATGGGAGHSWDPAAEKRYRKLFMGIDLTKHFYFSYTYNLAHTLQYNCCGAPQVPPVSVVVCVLCAVWGW